MARLPLTYCSFANDTTCLGVLILDGSLNPVQAARKAWALGLNPGGELLVFAIEPNHTDVTEREYLAMLENRNRLLTKWEARELFQAKSIGEIKDEEEAEQHGGSA